MTMRTYELLVVGGGPAGMACACEAAACGVSPILLAERSEYLGGVLPQCIHDGFGVTEFGRSMTGPEYAACWEKRLRAKDVEIRTNASVLSVEGAPPFTVRLTDPAHGLTAVRAKSVVFATGCRERTLGQLRIPGSRPAGIYTAGAAQYMMNVQNYLPGKSAVILGSGDIGLIMARRLTLEGVKVRLILGEKASGLVRNYIGCVRDFGLPICFGYTVVSVHGYGRLKGVTIAPAGGQAAGQRRYIPCDTLLVAAGLIPEAGLWEGHGQPLGASGGIPADAGMATPRAGLFACGNVVRVYDTADEVSHCGRLAGRAAAQWLGKRVPRADTEAKSYPKGRRLEEKDLQNLSGLLLCTDCPIGCELRVEGAGEQLRVTGNRCPRGEAFARREQEAPERLLTTTVRLRGSDRALLPVKTSRPIPKSMLEKAMRACRRVTAAAPAAPGMVVLPDLAGTGADLLAAGEAPRAEGGRGGL